MKESWKKVDRSREVLKPWQVFRVTDLRKESSNTFTVWSNEQMDRLLEEGVVNPEYQRIVFGVSAELGYSYSIAERRRKKQADRDEVDAMEEDYETEE